MEEEDRSQPNPLPFETLDPIAQKKHAAMLERLSNLLHSRLQQSIARRSDSAASSPAFESVHSFLDRFSDSKRSIEAALSRCHALASHPASAPNLKPELEKVSASIAALDRIVAENSYSLPSYEVGFSLKAISELKEALESAKSELMPRKKFSFKNKTSKRDPSVSAKEMEEIKVPDAEKSNLAGVRASPGFRCKEGAGLVKHFWVSEEGEGDFTLSDLNSCDVYLKGRIRALFVHRLRKCRIFAGPVRGSILLEDVNDCLFVLASRQIRIHQARATDFYLRVRSRPIIEDSSAVRFAPFRLFYEGIEEELTDPGPWEETELGQRGLLFLNLSV